MPSQQLLLKNIRNILHLSSRKCSSMHNNNIRNIGILAHIDAGKTTTTERMLFYSGKTNNLGEVHHGTTITDYLAQERERGITICSSAVTFSWNNYKINLMDTPGHIDFTMEVEQSLYAVDGAIVVLDGTAGVEAQTITVWTQSERHRLPKIIFINKMDRPDSDVPSCLTDIVNKLDIMPINLQLPVQNSSGLIGIIDIIQMQQIIWDRKSLGRDFMVVPLKADLHREIVKKRNELIDQLSTMDDDLAETIILNENFDNIPNDLVWKALRKATCNQKVVPVLLGSAYKNIGIQPLIDSVIKYLPKPIERNKIYNCFGKDLSGKVFKIVHDKQRGPLTLVRVFSGSLKKGMRIVNSEGTVEILQKIYEPLADEYREISELNSGDVGVCSGLKNTFTGDLILSNVSSLKNAQNKLQELLDKNNLSNLHMNNEIPTKMFAFKPEIPDAVYFCSIEPPSLAYQNALENALQQLQREDPSLRVNYDEITGQTVLGGMGELHMAIIKSRILTEYKIEADLGPLQIAYKETLESEMQDTYSIEKDIAGTNQNVVITMSLTKNAKELFQLDKSPDNATNLNAIRPRILQVIKKGALSALERGPRLGGQVVDTQIKLHNIHIGRGTADSTVMAAAAQCVQKILRKADTRLLEPIMAIQIILPSERVSSILGDLARRRAFIKNISFKGKRNKIIECTAPLVELTDYSSILRTISSGTASMTMQPSGYSNMASQEEALAIRRAQGLE